MKLYRKLIILLLLVLQASLSGCFYFADRGKDFADTFKFYFEIGYGLDAEVHATRYFSLSPPGYSNGRKVIGFEGRYGGTWSEERFGYAAVLPLPYCVIRDSQRTATGPNVLSQPTDNRVGYPYAVDNNVRKAEVGGSVFAGFVGINIGIDLYEFVDFLTGWFGPDISTDDTYLDDDLLELYVGNRSWDKPLLRDYVDDPTKAISNILDSNLATRKELLSRHSNARIFIPALESLNKNAVPRKYWMTLLLDTDIGAPDIAGDAEGNISDTILGQSFDPFSDTLKKPAVRLYKARRAISRLLFETFDPSMLFPDDIRNWGLFIKQ